MKFNQQSVSGNRSKAMTRSSGVALVITLILISVITFLAITFLALARRERGQVTTQLDQTTATFAAETGQDRAKAQLLATILQHTNMFDFGLLVSTNFINADGFDPAHPNFGTPYATNVNYDYYKNGNALSGYNDFMVNLTNLLYDPRVPVFITNKLYGSNDFRYYLDLNRDGRFTRTGWLIVTNEKGGFYDLSGNEIAPFAVSPVAPPPNNVLVQYFVGDPQYIGMLFHPEDTHSESNRFLSRYAFAVLPIGNTLDINYIHNHGKATPYAQEGFYRNQGVGSWENNFASFLADLNTNIWGYPQNPALFQYETNNTLQSVGLAFQDADSVTRYRYGYDGGKLYSVQNLYGGANGPGDRAFQFDQIDGYSAGPLVMNLSGYISDPDVVPVVRTTFPWPGADNTNHFFTDQELFDPAKTGIGAGAGNTFSDRLLKTTSDPLLQSSYDRYTTYRLLSQLGTDSAPEPDTKINVNYVNVGGLRATNFIQWNDVDLKNGNVARGIPAFGRVGSELFFSNVVNRLLGRYSQDWLNRSFSTYTNMFGADQKQPFGASRIPVFVNGQFVYTPSMHRHLQFAANLWDALYGTDDVRGALPTVFRPYFSTEGSNVYITNFTVVASADSLDLTNLVDVGFPSDVVKVKPDSLIFGVPLVVGARKGLPNFNEFSSEAVIQMTRKVELVKSAPGGGDKIVQTNQMFIIGISNVVGAEFWNSYTKAYSRPVDVVIQNFGFVTLTNDDPTPFSMGQSMFSSGTMTTNTWSKWNPKRSSGDPSFLVPLRTNHVIIPDFAYRFGTHIFDKVTTTFERPSGYSFPRWGLTVTNRVVAMIREQAAPHRIIDYVQLNGMVNFRDFSSDIAQPATAIGFEGVWGTNMPAGQPPGQTNLSDLPGIIQQIEISKGNVEAGGNWQNNGIGQPAGQSRDQAIANFLAFFVPGHTYTYQPGNGNGGVFVGTNDSLVANVPFTPTSKRSVPMVWQANDPLIHYTSGDMEYLEKSGVPVAWTPPTVSSNTLVNIGKLNTRYRPWNNYPNSPEDDKLAMSTVVKDPGITGSDAWEFPTNKLATLGWLGRIHRGTPWQTVYLKSTRVVDAVNLKAMNEPDWRSWTGNRHLWRSTTNLWYDAYMTQPEMDRDLLDELTTALNDNAGRGQLPINQSGLAAWSAVFGGMVALTNVTSDQDVNDNAAPSAYAPHFVDPAGVYDPANTNTWNPLMKLVAGINRTRADTNQFPSQTFTRLGDILATPELTEASPFFNMSAVQKEHSLNDVAYEWLPQQMLSLIRLGQPRFVIYAYGQTLKPAQRSIQVSGPYTGVCTNYQITAEVATRAVVRVVGSPNPADANNPDPAKKYPPRLEVESFNVLPPD